MCLLEVPCALGSPQAHSVGGKSVLKEMEASGAAQGPASDPNTVLDRGEALSFPSVSDTHAHNFPLSKWLNLEQLRRADVQGQGYSWLGGKCGGLSYVEDLGMEDIGV